MSSSRNNYNAKIVAAYAGRANSEAHSSWLPTGLLDWDINAFVVLFACHIVFNNNAFDLLRIAKSVSCTSVVCRKNFVLGHIWQAF